MLGHSISRYSNAANIAEDEDAAEQCKNVDMVLIYLPGAVGNEEKKKLEQVGWKLVPVEPLYGPTDAAEPHRQVCKYLLLDYA